MENRFNINESEKNRIRGLHNIKVINEQYSPEDRVTDNQCVGTATDRVVLEVFDELTEDYGYECVGKIESTPVGSDTELSDILLKKSIQGIVIYLYIKEVKWVSDVGTVSYYIPRTKSGDAVDFRGKEGTFRGDLKRELERLEDEVWEAVREGVNESRKPINEQGQEVTKKFDRDRSKFLDAYSEMSSHIYNVFHMDKDDMRSHDADKIILGFKKNEREMEKEMSKACRKYEEAKRYFSRYKDDWIWNE